MKRLITNSLLNATLLAVVMYVVLRVIIALMLDSNVAFSEIHLVAFAAFLGAFRSVVMLPADLYYLPTYRRLQRHFRIEDGLGKPGCWRTLSLLGSWSDFAKRAQAVITESLQTYSITGDSEGDNITLALFYLYGVPYKIRLDCCRRQRSLENTGDTCVVQISARHSHFLACLMPVDLGAMQIVAGLVQWAADVGLAERDSAPTVAPDTIEKDIGNWLSASSVSAVGTHTPPKIHHRPFPVRAFLTRGGLLLGAFLGLYVVDRFKIVTVPSAVQLLPLFLLAVYVSAQGLRTSAKSLPQKKETHRVVTRLGE